MGTRTDPLRDGAARLLRSPLRPARLSPRGDLAQDLDQVRVVSSRQRAARERARHRPAGRGRPGDVLHRFGFGRVRLHVRSAVAALEHAGDRPAWNRRLGCDQLRPDRAPERAEAVNVVRKRRPPPARHRSTAAGATRAVRGSTPPTCSRRLRQRRMSRRSIRALRLRRVDLYGDSYGSWFAQIFAVALPDAAAVADPRLDLCHRQHRPVVPQHGPIDAARLQRGVRSLAVVRQSRSWRGWDAVEQDRPGRTTPPRPSDLGRGAGSVRWTAGAEHDGRGGARQPRQ